MDNDMEIILSEHKSNPYNKINQFIEMESKKESYVISADRYGTVDDYMEITI